MTPATSTRKRLRIGYVVDQSLDEMPENLGHRIYVVALARALADAGHEVIFLNRRWERVVRIDATTGVQAEETGCRSRSQRGRQRLRRLTGGFFERLRFAAACATVLRGVDVIHEHFGLLQWGGTWAARRLGVPYVLHVHADDLAERIASGRRIAWPLQLLMRRLARANLLAADAIVTVSPALERCLVETWNVPCEKVHVLDNAVEDVFFDASCDGEDATALGAELGVRPGHRVITFIGSFHFWYDLPLLVRAFTEVRARHSEAKLVLVGEGDLREAVAALIRESGLDDEVSMPGCIAHRRIPALLAMSHVSVVPVSVLDDEFWCSPMKIFEAMAAGVPIVASAAGVVPQLLRGGRLGRLTPPGDVDAMADAITEVLEHPAAARILADTGRIVAREHTWEKYVGRLGEVYEALTGGSIHDRTP